MTFIRISPFKSKCKISNFSFSSFSKSSFDEYEMLKHARCDMDVCFVPTQFPYGWNVLRKLINLLQYQKGWSFTRQMSLSILNLNDFHLLFVLQLYTHFYGEKIVDSSVSTENTILYDTQVIWFSSSKCFLKIKANLEHA